MSEKRTLNVMLTVEVEALEGTDLADAGFFDGFDEDDEEAYDPERPNPISDYSAREVAEAIPAAITHPDNEIFAGTGLFVKIGQVRVVNSAWEA